MKTSFGWKLLVQGTTQTKMAAGRSVDGYMIWAIKAYNFFWRYQALSIVMMPAVDERQVIYS